MMTTYFKQLEKAIKTMHYRHGVGDIQEIQQFADGRIAVIAKGYGMKPHVRRGTVTGQTFGKRTIRLYGQQLTVIIIGE
jgi:hypothetical protein